MFKIKYIAAEKERIKEPQGILPGTAIDIVYS